MKKYPVLFIIATFCLANAAAVDIAIAPLSYITNGQEENKDVADECRAVLLEKIRVQGDKPYYRFTNADTAGGAIPVSVFDALSVCRSQNCEYLIYGYIQESETALICELKLFDYEKRMIVTTFHSADNREQQERLFADIAMKIIDYIEGMYAPASGEESEDPDNIVLRIPASFGYWTPLNPAWCGVILGTVSAKAGLEYIPDDTLLYLFGRRAYASGGVTVDYRLGVGNPAQYHAFLHLVEITIPVRLYVCASDMHEFSVGLGVQYSAGMLQYQDNFAPAEVTSYSSYGYTLLLGYRANVFEKMSFSFDVSFGVTMFDRMMVTCSPSFGVVYTIEKKQLEKSK